MKDSTISGGGKRGRGAIWAVTGSNSVWAMEIEFSAEILRAECIAGCWVRPGTFTSADSCRLLRVACFVRRLWREGSLGRPRKVALSHSPSDPDAVSQFGGSRLGHIRFGAFATAAGIRHFGRWLCALPAVVAAASISPVTFADEDTNAELHQLHRVLRMGSSIDDPTVWMTKVRGFVNFDTLDGIAPMFGNNADGQPFSWTQERAGPMAHPKATGAIGDPFAFAWNPVRNALAWGRDHGIRADIYEALAWQAASDTLPSTRSTAGGARFNARIDALFFRNPSEGQGHVTVQFRQNNEWPQGDGNISESLASPVYLDALVSSRDTYLARAFYSQSMLDDRLSFTVGKINPNDYVALNVFASDETTQYLAQQFDGNDVLPTPFQSYTPGVAVQAIATEWLTASAFFASADGATENGFSLALDTGYAVGAEANVLFELWDLPARLSFAWCGSDVGGPGAPSGVGSTDLWGNSYACTAQYFVTERCGLFFQWAWAEEDVAGTSTNEGGLGVTLDDVFGRVGDGAGLAVGWSEPTDPSLTTQGLLEAYYRMQVTGSLQVSLDVQVILPPTTDELSEPTIVGGVRAVIRF